MDLMCEWFWIYTIFFLGPRYNDDDGRVETKISNKQTIGVTCDYIVCKQYPFERRVGKQNKKNIIMWASQPLPQIFNDNIFIRYILWARVFVRRSEALPYKYLSYKVVEKEGKRRTLKFNFVEKVFFFSFSFSFLTLTSLTQLS